MGIANRPATCASCGTRLSQKSWYYRNGKYFCKRRCWETEKAKVEEERAKAGAKATEATEQPAEAKATDAGKAEAPAKDAPAVATSPKTEATKATEATKQPVETKADKATSDAAKTGVSNKGGDAA